MEDGCVSYSYNSFTTFYSKLYNHLLLESVPKKTTNQVFWRGGQYFRNDLSSHLFFIRFPYFV